jgi:hypothetical protein
LVEPDRLHLRNHRRDKATLRFLFRLDPQHLTLSAALDALGLGTSSRSVSAWH